MTTEVTLCAKQITEDDKQLAQDVADAARYRFLRDNCSWRSTTTQYSPLECGISFVVQELAADKQGWDIEDYIDEAIQEKKYNEN